MSGNSTLHKYVHRLSVIIIITLSAACAQAAIVFDNGAPTTGPGTIGFGADVPQLTADDFSVAAGNNVISGAHWWGSDLTSFSIHTFTVKVFGDDNAKPNDAPPLLAFEGSVVGIDVPGSPFPMKSYSVDFAPITVTPEVRYWLSITKVSPPFSNWTWFAHSGTAGVHAQQGTLGIWNVFPGEAAFYLVSSIPEPASYTMFLFGLLALAPFLHRTAARRWYQ